MERKYPPIHRQEAYVHKKILKRIGMMLFLFASIFQMNAQDLAGEKIVIKGTVRSLEDGESLPGVTILEKGTTNGVITDLNGTYSIEVEEGAVLVFSSVGFISQEIMVDDARTEINVEMGLDLQQLEEVVIVGYGSVKKRDLTGSVASVKAEEITRIPTHNAMEAIQGRVPGIDITRSSGAAGAGVNIVVRGNRSIGSPETVDDLNSPLVIIDGFQGGDINTINPNDIESIEILKDASATAIYGYQGANGVIIVTTKKGKEGKARVSYNSYYGINGFTPFPDVRLGEDFIALRREAKINSAFSNYNGDDSQLFTEKEWEAIQNDQWVNWVDLLMRNGTQQSHTVSVTGGSEKTKAYVSAGYFREEGMYRMNDMTRYNVRLNLDQEVNDWIKTGLLSQITYYNQNDRKDPLSAAISAAPLGTPYDEDGNIVVTPIAGKATVVSPLADEIKNAYKDNEIRTNINLNAYLELTPFRGFSFRSNFGANLNNGRTGQYFDADSYTRRNEKTSQATISSYHNRFFHWDNILSYSKDFDIHSFTITGITNYTQSISEYVYASGLNQQLASQFYHNLGATDAAGRSIESGFTQANSMSYAVRLNYSLKGKYLLTLTNRYDGVSRLAEGNKWSSFPSIAAAWRIIDEPFMSGVGLFDELKIRASYGLAGNSSIPVYGTQSGIYPSSQMSFGEVPAPMYQFLGRVGNNRLGWETSRTANIGLDMGFWGSRLTGTIDVYNTETSDILLLRTLPQSTGVSEVYQNIGATRNRGIELTLNSINFDNRNFRWTSTLTFTRNKEEITALIDGTDIISSDPNNSLLLGRPIRSIYTYKKLGIWQSDEAEEAAQYTFGGESFEPGDIKLESVNGDTIISADDDRQYIGSPTPKWFGGIRNTFSYKGLELNIFIVARWGQTIDAEFLGRYDPSGQNGTLALYDYWTPENPTNDYPRPRPGTLSGIPGYQTLSFVDGSYVKLKNVSLGYTLPQKWTRKIFIDNVKLYVTGANLYAISKSRLLKNYDPEGGGAESYPLNRQLVFGINLDF